MTFCSSWSKWLGGGAPGRDCAPGELAAPCRLAALRAVGTHGAPAGRPDGQGKFPVRGKSDIWNCLHLTSLPANIPALLFTFRKRMSEIMEHKLSWQPLRWVLTGLTPRDSAGM